MFKGQMTTLRPAPPSPLTACVVALARRKSSRVGARWWSGRWCSYCHRAVDYAWFFNQWLTVGASVALAAISWPYGGGLWHIFLRPPATASKCGGRKMEASRSRETATIAVLEEEMQKLKEEEDGRRADEIEGKAEWKVGAPMDFSH